jgi:hypothetical protein
MSCYSGHTRFPGSNASSLLLAALVLLKALIPNNAAAADSGEEIRGAAIGFYTVYLKVRPQGIPQGKAMAQLRPHLAETLEQNLRQARQAEEQYQKANHGAVPPLIEGDLFTSLFEGASAFRLLSCEARGDRGSCEIEFSAIDPKDRSVFKWKDKIYLVRQSRRWLIDDVEYLGNWAFMHRGRLRAVLRQAIEDSKT